MRANGHRFTGFHQDLVQHPRGRRRDFQVHLFRLDFQQRLIFFNRSAERNQPLHDSPFRDAFTELRHDDIGRHDSQTG
jgi:hypothetical protein